MATEKYEIGFLRPVTIHFLDYSCNKIIIEMKSKKSLKVNVKTSFDDENVSRIPFNVSLSIPEEITLSDDDYYLSGSSINEIDDDIVFVANNFTSEVNEKSKESDGVSLGVKFTKSTFKSYSCFDPDVRLIILENKDHFPCSCRIQCRVLLGRCQVNDFIMSPADEWTFIDAYTLGDYPTIIKNAQDIDEKGQDSFYESLENLCCTDEVERIKSASLSGFCSFLVKSVSTPLELRLCGNIYNNLKFKDASTDNFNLSNVQKIANKEKGDSYAKESVKALRQASSHFEKGENFVLMVTGPNNIGKSTFVRRFCNRALSDNLDAYHLEADCGQTEFTLPGCLALTKIRKPIFGDPFTHLRDSDKCYYFGDVQPSARLEDYLKLIKNLKNYFDCLTSEKKAVLVVNTNGWISDHGLQTLFQMINDIHPNRIVCISSGQTDSNIFNKALHGTFRNTGIVISRVSSLLNSDIVTSKKNGRFLRDLSITAYFGRLLTNFHDLNSPACLRSVAPYKIDLNSLKINVLHGISPPKFILSIVNANLVALCHSTGEELIFTYHRKYQSFQKASQYLEPSQERWINHENSPFVLNGESYPECLGFGIVRAIDFDNNAIYIVSPLSPEKITLVNVILKGAIDIPLPLIAKFNNGLNNCPYYLSSRETFDRKHSCIADYLNESIRNRSSHMKKKVRAS